MVAGEYPWPENSGSRIRLATVLRGLRRCGPTELFSVIPSARTDFDPPDPTAGLDRVGRLGIDDRAPSGWRLTGALARPTTPLGLPRWDRSEATGAVARFMSGHYDLIWYFDIRSWSLVGGLETAPTVLDLVDLEDYKIRARLAIPPATRRRMPERMKALGARTWSEEEARRWARLYRRAAGQSTVVVVCSELDAQRLRAIGVRRVEVVPNGYRLVSHPLGETTVHEPPVVLFQGTLRYPPNAEGARYLVDQVRPLLTDRIPDVQIRLVGRGTSSLSGLDQIPGVTLVGQVADIDDELEKADLVVVPVRFGSGTRLKILEAFAQRIPVVSTSLGAEGLGAVDGIHLLIGDTPAALADACVRLLSDPSLRGRLAEQAHNLFLDQFQSDVVEDQVARLAQRVADSAVPIG